MIPKAQRTVGIIQPNYLPWRGYFGFIAEVDFFVFLDDVQYTRVRGHSGFPFCLISDSSFQNGGFNERAAVCGVGRLVAAA